MDYDTLIVNKLNDCGNWLKTLEPIQKDSAMADLFLSYGSGHEREQYFKKWVLDNIKPNALKVGIREVGHRLIVQNGFLVTDFKPKDLEKFLMYLKLFATLCRTEEEKAANIITPIPMDAIPSS